VPDSILDRKPLIYVWRPVYQRFLAPVVWPLLGLSSQTAESGPRSADLVFSSRSPRSEEEAWQAIGRIEARQLEILERLDRLEARAGVDWALIEQVLISLWSESAVTSAASPDRPWTSDAR
jgi:hypothetical protein